jgi:ABC-type polysaccharide/polyol phosphate transport system ATPase subunit
MAIEPNILLLDEVLAVGDESFREKSMNTMRDLLGNAGTIVFVSHSLVNVEEFCDRVAYFESGQIQAIGEAAEVVDIYRSSV